MRKRGYKRASIKSQAFREERLRSLQSHPLRNKKVSSHSCYLAYTSIWLEHIIQEIIPLGFEDIKGEGIPCFYTIF